MIKGYTGCVLHVRAVDSAACANRASVLEGQKQLFPLCVPVFPEHEWIMKPTMQVKYRVVYMFVTYSSRSVVL